MPISPNIEKITTENTEQPHVRWYLESAPRYPKQTLYVLCDFTRSRRPSWMTSSDTRPTNDISIEFDQNLECSSLNNT